MSDRQTDRMYIAIFALFMIIILGEIGDCLSELIEIGLLPDRNIFMLAVGTAMLLARIALVYVVIYIIWTRGDGQENDQ